MYIYILHVHYEWQKTDSCWWSKVSIIDEIPSHQMTDSNLQKNWWRHSHKPYLSRRKQDLLLFHSLHQDSRPRLMMQVTLSPLMLPMVATPKRESDTDRNGSTHQRTHRYPHLARLEPACLVAQVHAKEFDQFLVCLTAKWENHSIFIYIYIYIFVSTYIHV